MATIQKVSFSLRLLLKKLSVRTAAVNLVSLVSALVDLSQAHNDELKPIDVYAIGFEEMVDLDLHVHDGLLAIRCQYPSDKDTEELPRVWLTGNEIPWDPKILEEGKSIQYLLVGMGSQSSCWQVTKKMIPLMRSTVLGTITGRIEIPPCFF